MQLIWVGKALQVPAHAQRARNWMGIVDVEECGRPPLNLSLGCEDVRVLSRIRRLGLLTVSASKAVRVVRQGVDSSYIGR